MASTPLDAIRRISLNRLRQTNHLFPGFFRATFVRHKHLAPPPWRWLDSPLFANAVIVDRDQFVIPWRCGGCRCWMFVFQCVVGMLRPAINGFDVWICRSLASLPRVCGRFALLHDLRLELLNVSTLLSAGLYLGFHNNRGQMNVIGGNVLRVLAVCVCGVFFGFCIRFAAHHLFLDRMGDIGHGHLVGIAGLERRFMCHIP